MGTGISTSRQKIYQKVLQKQVQKGGSASCQNITGDIDLVFEDTKVKGLVIRQECRTNARQLYEAMLTELTQTILDTQAETKGGIGFTFAEAKTEAESIVEQIQEQNCPDSNVSNIQGDINIRGKGSNINDLLVEQIGNAEQECIFNGMADAINDLTSTTTAKATGWLAGGGFAAIVALLVLGGIAIALFRRRQEKKQKGGGSKTVCASILLIVLIVAFIIAC